MRWEIILMNKRRRIWDRLVQGDCSCTFKSRRSRCEPSSLPTVCLFFTSISNSKKLRIDTETVASWYRFHYRFICRWHYAYSETIACHFIWNYGIILEGITLVMQLCQSRKELYQRVSKVKTKSNHIEHNILYVCEATSKYYRLLSKCLLSSVDIYTEIELKANFFVF